jgi:hypothetical protein
MSLGGGVEVGQQRSAGHPGAASGQVDVDLVHRTQVDDDAVVDHRGPRHAVRSSAHRHLESSLNGEPHRLLHVCLVETPGDGQWSTIDAGVPDAPALVIPGIRGGDDVTLHPAAQLDDRVLGRLGHRGLLRRKVRPLIHRQPTFSR